MDHYTFFKCSSGILWNSTETIYRKIRNKSFRWTVAKKFGILIYYEELSGVFDV